MGSGSSEKYTRLNNVLEEIAARFRRGERPELQAYALAYPDLAGDIRDLFPAMAEIEQVAEQQRERSSQATKAMPPLRQLGDYRILREIGRGGMGVVYEAEQESLERHVALKVLPAHALLDPRQVQRFHREARAAARLHHSNIVPVFGVGEHDGLHYYVMQYIRGQGLDQVINELRRLRHAAADKDTDTAKVSFRLPAVSGWQSNKVAQSGDEPDKVVQSGDEPDKVAQSASGTAVSEPLAADDHTSRSVAGPDDQGMQDAVGGTVQPASSLSEVQLPGQRGNSTLSEAGRMYWQSVARIGIQAAEALAYAHAQGTLHRDIKPSNLLLDTQGVVWVADFGLAKSVDSEDLTHSGDVVGTLRYIAPERFQAKGDGRSDLYALGLTLYELLTLRPAFAAVERDKLLMQVMTFEPPTPRKLNPQVPRDLETIVLKAMARDPADRYQSAGELAEDLRHFVDDKPIRARQIGELEKMWRWCRRNPVLSGLAGAFVLVLILGSAGTAWKWREADSERRNVVAAERETALQRDGAIHARNDSQRLLSSVMLDKGIALAEQGEVGEGLLWMAQALKAAPDDADGLRQVVRTNLAAWSGAAHRLRFIVEQPFGHVVFSADGERLVTAAGDNVIVWAAATGEQIDAWRSPGNEEVVAISPDAQRFLTVLHQPQGKPEQLQRRDAAGKPIGAPLPHPGPILAAVFSPDGKLFATGCGDRTARLWATAAGNEPLHSFLADQGEISTLAVSPDGGKLAVGTTMPPEGKGPAAAFLFDLGRGERIGQPLSHRIAVRCVEFSPDGKTVLTAGWDGVAQLWDAATGLAAGLPMQHPKEVNSIRFAPDGRTIVTGGKDGVVRWWDAATSMELIGMLPLHRGSVNDLAFSPDGNALATLSNARGNGTIHRWDIARGMSRPASKSKEAVLKASWALGDGVQWYGRQSVAYSPDGARVLTGGTEGFARMTSSAAAIPLGTPLRHSWERVHVLAMSGDGRLLATSSQDGATAVGEVWLWDAATCQPIRRLAQVNWVSAMAFSPDGKLLAAGGFDTLVHLWDTASGEPTCPPLRQGDIVLSLAFSPDGKTLAAGLSHDYSGMEGIALWDVAAGRQIGRKIPGSKDRLQFSPDGKYLLVAESKAMRLLDVGALRADDPAPPVVLSMTEAAEVNSMVFSSDGQSILTGSTDGSARLWDANSGKPIGAPMVHPHRIDVVAFSPDRENRLILVACSDGSARLWDRATQKPLGPPVLQRKAIMGAGFLPDGRSFLTTAEDGSTRLWPVSRPAEDDVDRLMLRLQIRTGLEMGDGQSVRPLGPAEWEQRRRQFLALDGANDGAEPVMLSDRDFHDVRARDAEQDGAPFSSLWHLDRLIAAQEKETAEKAIPSSTLWLSYARRAHLHVIIGKLAQAEVDTAAAFKLASPDLLRLWYRHRLVDCKAGKRWDAALWYLDRLLAAEPKDWQLYAQRAAINEKRGKLAEFAADIDRAVQEGADGPFLIRVAYEFGEKGSWDKAASLFDKASQQRSVHLSAWQSYALAALKRNDQNTYRRICRRLADSANTASPSAGLANGVAWVCALGPDGLDDYKQAVALSEFAVSVAPPGSRASLLNTLGAVLYRAGRLEDAVERLNAGMAAGKGQGNVQDWVFLAMAHHRLGKTAEAHKYMERVKQYRPQGGAWEKLEVELLRTEAGAVIEGPVAEPKK